ncbi:c-type cytochrome [Aquihabitans daechungensis]|uniref:c-type cytochrome n=1 Tax=Aquihabitans daechungensis TaxID=1052257 RepID=UPI003BA3DE63
MLFAEMATQTSIGLLLLLIAVIIGVVYAFVTIRQAKPEIGSEIELAPNRKAYYADEELEGRKLDRTLSYGLLGLFIIGIGLPLYWLAEPGRQDGAKERINDEFVKRGAAMFDTTENGGYNCAFCHGVEGVGGATPYTLTDSQGRFIKTVTWQGPALNTVFLRYSRDEVRYVLTYGRPFSPMPPWGTKGGGPLTEQKLQELMDYMSTFQLTPAEAQAEVKEQLEVMKEAKDETCVAARTDAAKADLSEAELAEFDETTVDVSSCPPMYESEGEMLFNMGYDDGFAGGAYSCGRCHTKGWSYGEKAADGSGAFGPPLTNVLRQFPGASLGPKDQTDFVCNGSDQGIRYGQTGQGTGRMPGFCITPGYKINAENGEVGIEPFDTGTAEEGGMLTQEQVRLVTEYERSLARE